MRPCLANPYSVVSGRESEDVWPFSEPSDSPYQNPGLTSGAAVLHFEELRRRETGTVTAVSGSFKLDCSGHLGD